MLILALAVVQPVAAQSFKPDFEAGHGAWGKEDYATALKHWKPLAKQGHPKAQLRLGNMYRFGRGVKKDYKQAVKLFSLSAKQGEPYSLYNLGVMYRDGKGVLQDLVMAYVWFNLATTNHHKIVPISRDKVLSRLTGPERRLALKLSKLCLRKPAKCPEYSDD